MLDVAAVAFAEKGYLGASTRDIAERLGIRAASLYYYLPSKEAALLAICKLGVLDFIENLKDIIASRAPAAEKLRAAVSNHLLPLRSHPAADYVRVFALHRHELPDGARQEVGRLARAYQGLIQQIFEEGIASGEFAPDVNAERATLGLLGMCNSVLTARSLPPTSTVDDFIDEYSRIFIQGVMAKPGTTRNGRKTK
ncbi:TetR/AcrR family transcriptional regulator [Microbacteriaceae bacterium K1510]|nr:TetR/AcrR family transcriptional regulator [Microbacteriaceae bacterium K1510]